MAASQTASGQERGEAAETPSTGEVENKNEGGVTSEQSEATAPPEPWMQLIRLRKSDPSDGDIERLVHEQVRADLATESLAVDYNIVFLYDDYTLVRSDTDRVYKALTTLADRTKPLLLILNSGGGNIAPAYFIAKICREYSSDRFEIAVPRRAKSAATLICCGADQIHMGSLSELGPLDPQFEGVPALALKYSIEHLAELAKRYPAASDMFAAYLGKALRIEALGYYERVAESAVQYAERLLRSRRNGVTSADDATEIARRLVYAYKDHGFAIEANEASEIFGKAVVHINSPQYALANRLYQTLDLLSIILRDGYNRHFSFTGSASSGCLIAKREAE